MTPFNRGYMHPECQNCGGGFFEPVVGRITCCDCDEVWDGETVAFEALK